MRIRQKKQGHNQQPRKGAMLIFVLALLVVVLAMVVFSVDIAFMQLARTELHAVTDAAAKAAAGELANTNGDKVKAIEAGIRIANLNEVAGKPLKLIESDFEFGQSVKQTDGSWLFQPNAIPYTAVRVTGAKVSGSASGPVNLFFAPIFGQNVFSPTHVSIASEFDQDLVLVIDRSHSMCFDESGVDWNYPDGVDEDNTYYAPPHPTQSRWAKLSSAINTFLVTVKTIEIPPHVALVTWASEFGPGSNEANETGQTWPAVSRDVDLGTDYDGIENIIQQRGSNTMVGATNLAAGIDEGVAVLISQSRADAKRSLIVMTDGQWNTGRHPVDAAEDANSYGITIYTITFLDKADQSTMQQVAEATGGRHYHASNADQLQAIFDELARSLPVALTK